MALTSSSELGLHGKVTTWNYLALRVKKIMIVTIWLVINGKESIDLEIT